MSDQTESFDFSTEPKSLDFSIDNTTYRLREATEDAHIAYRNTTMANLVMQDGKGTIVGGAEADAVLIAKCLFKLVDGKEQAVAPHFVKNLPRRIFVRLLGWVRKNSGMDEDQESAEFLRKRIADDQKKLAVLEKDGSAGKDAPSSTTGS